MASVMKRTMDWVDLTVDLLASPAGDFPMDVVGRRLVDSFDLDVSALNCRRPDGSTRLAVVTRTGADHGGLGASAATDVMVAASNSQLLAHHPLVRWFAMTQLLAPQSLNRVPREITQSERSDEVIDLLHAVGVEQEMALPLLLQGGQYVVLSLNRPGAKDFCDEDMQTAARIQPLLIAIWSQARVLEHCAWADSINAHELTGRERAVLQLLATGRTADAIGRVLGCSGRTVEKHIEHLYRKLGVSDRVSAVRVAYEDGLIADHFGTQQTSPDMSSCP